jgi:hypothetical protein
MNRIVTALAALVLLTAAAGLRPANAADADPGAPDCAAYYGCVG